MLLLVGLGNPGPQYENTRHNIGFLAADAVAQGHGFSDWRSRFKGMTAEGRLGTEKVLLLKPMTYMNESGRAVGEAVRFFKLAPIDVVVLHDEIDLAPAKLRMKAGGGHAGNNGLRSIHAHIGPDYRRLRIGVGRPQHKDAVANYVLHPFSKSEMQWVTPLLDAVVRHAPLLAQQPPGSGDNDFMSKTAQDLLPPKPERSAPKSDAAD